MMGQDIERILAGVNSIKEITTDSIKSLANANGYQLTCKERHGGTSTTECFPKEEKVPSPASSYVDPIRAGFGAIQGDYGKMESLSKSLFTSSNQFNNGYGSPWTELTKLNEAIEAAEEYAGAHSNLDWVSEKASLLSLLNMVLSHAIDVKWALIYYHDYVQRGFDNKYNGNNPSIKFTDGIEKETIGNVKQKYEENVNIPQKSIDPF